jgi:hypothetical protein
MMECCEKENEIAICAIGYIKEANLMSNEPALMICAMLYDAGL